MNQIFQLQVIREQSGEREAVKEKTASLNELMSWLSSFYLSGCSWQLEEHMPGLFVLSSGLSTLTLAFYFEDGKILPSHLSLIVAGKLQKLLTDSLH